MVNVRVTPGDARPMGPTLVPGGINFAVFSKNATHVVLVLFNELTGERLDLPLDPDLNRTGQVWHIRVLGIGEGIGYCWRMGCHPNPVPHLNRYNLDDLLLDPYATAVMGGEYWGKEEGIKPRRGIIPNHAFNWEDDRPLKIPLSDTVIYELNVRGYTAHSSSGVSHPGTFRGLIEKIPYLKDLGITAVELLPVHEFEEAELNPWNPLMGTTLLNLWGYQPVNFFSPNAALSADQTHGGQVLEFKEMVKAFHKAGIEVFLDVVFNHSSEGDERGVTRSFRGIDNAIYYILDPETGEYRNYSGCGNTLNCNHPVVRRMITDCLLHWVTEMHIDGFRFDLASILGRGRDGEPLANPPLLEDLADDPILADTKLIAEAWDAAGLYQVGTFPHWGRWAEWNGRFRDDIRRFVRGDEGMTSALATRLLGSADLYHTSARQPYHSINFVTAHDGFTLRDLVSYNTKHNEANGEDNRDGADENYSDNYGVEGETDDAAINAIRFRQQKNIAALLLLSHGVPMILGGDEMSRTQRGNNNAYCQDNDISWVDWRLVDENKDLWRFFRTLIHFRKTMSILRPRIFANGEDDDPLQVRWHGVKRDHPDMSHFSHSLGMELVERQTDGVERHFFLIANSYHDDLSFELPHLPPGLIWRRYLDTSVESPKDIADPGSTFPLRSQKHYVVKSRSVLVLLA